MTDTIGGFLEIGRNESDEVVINHPDLKPDENGVGHIVFSPAQARHLASLLVKCANAISEQASRASAGVGADCVCGNLELIGGHGPDRCCVFSEAAAVCGEECNLADPRGPTRGGAWPGNVVGSLEESECGSAATNAEPERSDGLPSTIGAPPLTSETGSVSTSLAPHSAKSATRSTSLSDPTAEGPSTCQTCGGSGLVLATHDPTEPYDGPLHVDCPTCVHPAEGVESHKSVGAPGRYSTQNDDARIVAAAWKARWDCLYDRNADCAADRILETMKDTHL